MLGMFDNAKQFNRDLSSWSLANAEDMSLMFAQATAFNQSLANWRPGNYTLYQGIVFAADSFEKDLPPGWDDDVAREAPSE